MSEQQTYKAWFKIVNEPKWCTASKEWDTKALAEAHALLKIYSWTAAEDWCVCPTGVNPNDADEYEEHWDAVIAPAEVQGNPRNINEERKDNE